MSFKRTQYDAVIVGSGPNGLSAAIYLQLAGLSVLVLEKSKIPGGGMSTQELTLPGYAHDLFSAVHPFARASPFFKKLPLEPYGLHWIESPVQLAHPFEDGSATLLFRSLEETAARLGKDEKAYLKLFRPLVSNFETLIQEILAPPLHFPKKWGAFARYGLSAIPSAQDLAEKRFETEEAKALFMGIAAHSSASLKGFASSAVGLALQTAAHASGWPVPQGGAQAIANALTLYFKSLGGELVTEFEVTHLDELPPSRLVFFDLTPRQMVKLQGLPLKASTRLAFESYQYGPGAFKMDWALQRPIPWMNESCTKSATVHLGGFAANMIDSEERSNHGQTSQRPFILLSQPSLFDETRAPTGKHTAWAYCHVPNGSRVNMSEVMEQEIERVAPGFKQAILARRVFSPAQLEFENPNLVGGDISGGLVSPKQLFFRPRMTLNPYALDGTKYWICSSSTPPGPGVHGMCGYHAAKAALSKLTFGMRSAY